MILINQLIKHSISFNLCPNLDSNIIRKKKEKEKEKHQD